MQTTTKQVKQELRDHVLDYFTKDYGWDEPDTLENLKEQLESFSYMPTDYAKGEYMAQGGSFLIYYDEQREFIEQLLGQEDTKDIYTDQQVFDKYVHLVARTIQDLVA